jgi:hypothetical protein
MKYIILIINENTARLGKFACKLRGWSLLLALAVVALISCENKELYRCDDPAGRVHVRVVYHWPDDAQQRPLRLHLYSPAGSLTFVGDFPPEGGVFAGAPGVSRYPVCFDYMGPQTLDFRGQENINTFEVYCHTSAASLEGVPPPVVAEPSPGSFYSGYGAELFTVPAGALPGDTVILDMYPREVLRTFTFLLVGVDDLQGIADIRGFLSGFAGSFFAGRGVVSSSPASVVFTELTLLLDGMRQPWTKEQKGLFSELNPVWDKPESDGAWSGGWITGQVAAFAPSAVNFRLAVEVLSRGNEDIQAAWDDEVNAQMRGALGANSTPQEQEQWRLRNGGFDVVLMNGGRLVIPGGNGGGGAFDTGLNEWEDIVVPL